METNPLYKIREKRDQKIQIIIKLVIAYIKALKMQRCLALNFDVQYFELINQLNFRNKRNGSHSTF